MRTESEGSVFLYLDKWLNFRKMGVYASVKFELNAADLSLVFLENAECFFLKNLKVNILWILDLFAMVGYHISGFPEIPSFSVYRSWWLDFKEQEILDACQVWDLI